MNMIAKLAKLSSHETPYSFKADLTIGQTSCKYFSKESNLKKKKNQNPKSRAKHLDKKNFQKLKLYLCIVGREWRRIWLRAFQIHSKKGRIFWWSNDRCWGHHLASKVREKISKSEVLIFFQNLTFRFSFLLIFLVFSVLREERHKRVVKIQIYPYF